MFKKRCPACGDKMPVGSLTCRSCGRRIEITDAQFGFRATLYGLMKRAFLICPVYVILLLIAIFNLARGERIALNLSILIGFFVVIIPLVTVFNFIGSRAHEALIRDYIDDAMAEELAAVFGANTASGEAAAAAAETVKTCELVPPRWWDNQQNNISIMYRGTYRGMSFTAMRMGLSVVTVNTEDTYRAKSCFLGIWIVCEPELQLPASLRAWEKSGREWLSKAQRAQAFATEDAATDKSFFVHSEDPIGAKALLTPEYFALLSTLHRIPAADAAFGAVDGRFHIVLNAKKIREQFLTGLDLGVFRSADNYRKTFRASAALLEELLLSAAEYRDSLRDR